MLTLKAAHTLAEDAVDMDLDIDLAVRKDNLVIFQPDGMDVGVGPIVVDLETGNLEIHGSLPHMWPAWLRDHTVDDIDDETDTE